MDFDANGVVDATEVSVHDGAGRLVSSTYRYTGDSVGDRLNLAGTRPTSNTFTYNAQGRLTRLEATQDGGSSSFGFDYGPEGLATGGSISVTSSSGSFSGSLAFSYGGTLLTGYTQTLGGQPVANNTFTHDARGRRITQEQRTPGSSIVLRTDYTWNDDNRLTRVRRDAGAGEEVYTMAYSNGVQTETVKTVAGAVAYRVVFSHDSRGRVARAQFDRLGDGTVDAVWNVVWEDGPCIDPVLPVWDPLLDTRTGWGASVRGETARCGG